jgi:hypothetical protein
MRRIPRETLKKNQSAEYNGTAGNIFKGEGEIDFVVVETDMVESKLK